ncbi:MAG: DUF7453 family protein [Planctomycetota bacterium]|jgi:hypothetical protein
MNGSYTRLAGPLALASAALVAAPHAASAGLDFTISTMVIEGDTIAGVGSITRIDNLAVNDAGAWLVEADTNNADTNLDSVLIRNDLLYLREGDALAMPPGSSLDSFDSINLSNAPASGFNFFLDGTSGSGDDSGVYFYPGSDPFDGVLVVQESEPAPGLTPGTPFIGFFDVKINDADQLMVVSSVDDPNIATTVDRALYILETDDQLGGITNFDLVAAEGDILPGQTEPVADFGTGPHQSAINDAGHLLFFADLAGDTSVDGTMYHYDGIDRLLLAQEGSPSPVPGRNWSSLSSPEVDLGNGPDHVYSGSLDGDTATNLLIVRNGLKFRQEGDTVTTGTGTWNLTSFGSGPILVDDCGNVLWYGDWNDPNLDLDTGLFLNDQLLVQEGVTMIDGIVVDLLRGIQDGYDLSDNGRYVLFEAQLVDGREGAFLLDFGSGCGAVPCPADDCGDGNGSVDIVDLLALLAAWGDAGGACDIVPDGSVDIQDLLALLAAWGPCP